MINKRLFIGSWNLCDGLCNKVMIVKQLLYQGDFDVLFLQETEIPQQYDVRALNIEGILLSFVTQLIRYDLLPILNRTLYIEELVKSTIQMCYCLIYRVSLTLSKS